MKKNCLLIACCCCWLFAIAQNNEEPVYHAIDKTAWEKTVDGMDYYEKPDPAEPEKQADPNNNHLPTFDTRILQIIGFCLVGAILIFVLYQFFGKGLFDKNRKLKKDDAQRTYDLDEKPMESDLERYLREALAENDHRLAIRIYYLLLLKSLHEKRLIVWKKNKTNMDYLSEVYQHPDIVLLQRNTLIFEYVWYGDTPVIDSQFSGISESFTSLIRKIAAEK